MTLPEQVFANGFRETDGTFLPENVKGRNHLRYLGVVGRIILIIKYEIRIY